MAEEIMNNLYSPVLPIVGELSYPVPKSITLSRKVECINNGYLSGPGLQYLTINAANTTFSKRNKGKNIVVDVMRIHSKRYSRRTKYIKTNNNQEHKAINNTTNENLIW